MTGWFTTFFKDSVDPEDNFDSRPGANLFIKHVKYQPPPGATVASVAPSQDATDMTKQTDTETVPFNSIITLKEFDEGEVDSKQVDTEEEKLKERYEDNEAGGGGGAGDDGEVGAADGEIVSVTTDTETPTTSPDCFGEQFLSILLNHFL